MDNIHRWESRKHFLPFACWLMEKASPYSDYLWTDKIMCKYVQLRIDMRDGGFIFQNQNGGRVDPVKFIKDIEGEVPNWLSENKLPSTVVDGHIGCRTR